MAQSNKPALVLACNIEAINPEERVRYNVILKKIMESVNHQTELSDGYAWQLDAENVRMPEVAEWIEMERKCCPFLTLQIEAAGNAKGYTLRLLGPKGVKAFLVSEFGMAR
jgi:hypothetical protein